MMKLRAIKWVVFNAAFVAFMWLAFAENIEGARNVVLFASWLMFVTSLVTLDGEVRTKLAEVGRTVPAWLDASLDTLVVGVFLWHAWWFTGIAYTVHMVLFQSAFASRPKSSE